MAQYQKNAHFVLNIDRQHKWPFVILESQVNVINCQHNWFGLIQTFTNIDTFIVSSWHFSVAIHLLSYMHTIYSYSRTGNA